MRSRLNKIIVLTLHFHCFYSTSQLSANTNSLTADPAVHRHQSLTVSKEAEWKACLISENVRFFDSFLLASCCKWKKAV